MYRTCDVNLKFTIDKLFLQYSPSPPLSYQSGAEANVKTAPSYNLQPQPTACLNGDGELQLRSPAGAVKRVRDSGGTGTSDGVPRRPESAVQSAAPRSRTAPSNSP